MNRLINCFCIKKMQTRKLKHTHKYNKKFYIFLINDDNCSQTMRGRNRLLIPYV